MVGSISALFATALVIDSFVWAMDSSSLFVLIALASLSFACCALAALACFSSSDNGANLPEASLFLVVAVGIGTLPVLCLLFGFLVDVFSFDMPDNSLEALAACFASESREVSVLLLCFPFS